MLSWKPWKRELYELKLKFKDLKYAYEELWKSFTKTRDELNELKIKMKERAPNKEFDFGSVGAVCYLPTVCGCWVK